jgi:regulator of CtrA degradation
MTTLSDINPRIIESLYNEALVLADEARAAFDLSRRSDNASEDEDLTRIALSCEALRTTTQMMQSIAWLLNQRAYFKGEISELQLRRHGRLPVKSDRSDPEQLAFLDEETCEIIACSERLYARIARLDRAWQAKFAIQTNAVEQLHERLFSNVALS